MPPSPDSRMRTLFISDLHLDDSRPHITALFLDFLARDAANADALYILGDLFEAWIGDDAPSTVGDQVAAGLAALHARGVPSFFIHGNRDFLVGDAFARRARMTLLPDPSLIEIDGERVLLMHGDTLCIDDAKYQAFRGETRSPEWQRRFLALPVAERMRFAEQARAESRRYTRLADSALMDVNVDEVDRTLAAHRVRRLVHGHTHRPNVHRWTQGDAALERIVLGDWYDHGSLLTWQNGRCSLTSF
jgi:UDP-2,3-diacylglucosamine hydrolase